jgi:hypothetical protein
MDFTVLRPDRLAGEGRCECTDHILIADAALDVSFITI